jgi:hypothetical protein
MRHNLKPWVALIAFLSVAAPAFGHHAFLAEYDSNKCVDLKGTLTKVDWDNPHMYFYVDARDDNGKVIHWSFEGAALALMQRAGTHKVSFTENIGKVVGVRACMAKNGGARAAAVTMTTPDGVIHKVGVGLERTDDTPAQDSQRAHNRAN